MRKTALIFLFLTTFSLGCSDIEAMFSKPVFYQERKGVYIGDIFDNRIEDQLAVAIKKGDFGLVKKLTDQDPRLIHVKGINGVTPLWLAVKYQHPEIVEFLLEHGADPNAAISNVHTIVAEAARGTPGILQMILQHGGRFDVVSEGAAFDMLPIHIAASSTDGDITNVQILLNAGEDINAQAGGNSAGLTALFYAIGRGHFDLALFLLEAGADPTIRQHSGASFISIFYSTTYGRKWLAEDDRIIRWLQEHGYDVEELRKGKKPSDSD